MLIQNIRQQEKLMSGANLNTYLKILGFILVFCRTPIIFVCGGGQIDGENLKQNGKTSTWMGGGYKITNGTSSKRKTI